MMARVLSLLLLLPCVMGVTLRLADITSTAISNLDEGGYMMEGKKLLRVGQASLAGLAMMRENVRAGFLDPTEEQKGRLREIAGDGWELSYGKPLHSLAIGIGLAVCGPEPWVGNLIGALAGSLTLLVLGLWAARLGGVRYALIAAGFLGAEYFHLHYSRSSFSEALSSLLYLATVYQVDEILRSESASFRRRFFTGCLLGLCFLASYRALPVLVLSVPLMALVRGSFRQLKMSMPALLLGFVVPICCLEFLYLGYFHLSGAFGVLLVRVGPVTSIVRQLLFGGGAGEKVLLGSLSYPVETFRMMNGMIPLLIVMGGAACAWWAPPARRASSRMVLALLLPTALVGCFVSTPQARFFSFALPLAAVLAAELFEAVLARLEGCWPGLQVVAVILVTCLFCLLGLRNHHLLPPRSGYVEVSERIRSDGPGKVLCTNSPILAYFLGRSTVLDRFADEDLDPEALAARGISHVVLCSQAELGEFRERIREQEARLATKVTPMLFENPAARHPALWLDNQIWSRSTLETGERLFTIRVYRVTPPASPRSG